VTALETLEAARAAGVTIALDGEHLALEAVAPPPPALINELAQHKAEIVALLRRENDGWNAEAWRAYFDERAGVAEFDGGLPRPQAEERAFACCVAEWLRQHPVSSTPGRCLGCNGGDRADDRLMPYGIESSGLAWLHFGCWPAWHRQRQAKAVDALTAAGLRPPARFLNDVEPKGGT